MKSFFKEWLKTLPTVFAVVIVLNGVELIFDEEALKLDDTDNIADQKRSGLKLYTDQLTGCQYISAGLFGGLTPRVDAKQQHLGCS